MTVGAFDTSRIKDPATRAAFERIKEQLAIYKGLTGDALDAVVTRRDLVAGGLAAINLAALRQAQRTGAAAGSAITPVNRAVDPTPPARLAGLATTGGPGFLLLDWTAPLSDPLYGYTEIWRATTDDRGLAERLATTTVGVYSDVSAIPGTTYYYWVRAISPSAVAGPYNAINGVPGTALLSLADPDSLLGLLAESHLAAALNARIDNIDTPSTGLLARAAALETYADDLQLQIADLSGTSVYDSGTSYVLDDIVKYSGGLYRCIQATAAPSELPTNTAYWDKIGDYASLGDAVAAHSVAIEDHETRVTAAEGAITAQASDITTLQSGLTAADSATAANATAISGLDTRVTSNEGDLVAQTTAIQRLSATLATDNLLPDGSFSLADQFGAGSMWTDHAQAALLPTGGYGAGPGMKVTANGSINDVYALLDTNQVRIPVSRGDQLYVSYRAWVSPDFDGAYGVGTTVFNKDGTNLDHYPGLTKSYNNAATGTWLEWAGTVLVDVAGAAYAAFRLGTRNDATTGYVIFDDIRVSRSAPRTVVEANATAITGLDTRVTAAEGTITAQASAVTALQSGLAATDGVAAANATAITGLDTRVTSAEGGLASQASAITALEAGVGDNVASIAAEAVARADADGTLSSEYTIKTQVRAADGKLAIAGIGVAVEAGASGATSSEVAVLADKFVVLDPTGAGLTSPFAVVDGSVYIVNGVIQDAAITSAKILDAAIVSAKIGLAAVGEAHIEDAAVTNAKIGQIIEASNYVTGVSGWRINKNGTAEFQDVIARGDVQASSLVAGTAMVGTANIIDAAVDTLKIAGRAVTFPVAVTVTADVVAPTSDDLVIPLFESPAQVLVQATVGVKQYKSSVGDDSVAATYAEVKRGGVTIAGPYIVAEGTDFFVPGGTMTINFLDAGASGVETYTLHVSSSGYTATIDERTFIVTEYIR